MNKHNIIFSCKLALRAFGVEFSIINGITAVCSHVKYFQAIYESKLHAKHTRRDVELENDKSIYILFNVNIRSSILNDAFDALKFLSIL